MANKIATLRPDIEAGAIWYFNKRHLEEVLPISVWLEWVRRMAESRPLKVEAPNLPQFRHPWNVQLSFNPFVDGWAFNVEPGMVGEQDPYRYKPADDTHPERYKVYIDELNSPYFDISNKTWIPVGTDGTGLVGGSVPDFFLARGVSPAETITQTLQGLEFESDPFNQKARLLRRCDLVLVQPRPALSAVIDDEGLQLSVVQPHDKEPHISVVSKFEPSPTPEFPALAQLAAAYNDRGEEELHLATLYLLSSPGHAHGETEYDLSWTGYAQNHIFWNLDFAIDQVLEIIPETRLDFPAVGLAGGIGDAAIQSQLTQINDLNAQADALLNTSRIAGHFWTV
ncbi:MAG: hypothetical protein ACTSU8_02135 [Alphaproteobacteria bacterium]